MDLEQSQRRDINAILGDKVGLGLDEENVTSSPFLVNLCDGWRGNNWFVQSSKIVKLNITENDSIVFEHKPITSMAYKDITKMIIGFDYEITNVSANYPVLSNISLTCLDMTNYMLVENILTTQGHIDVDCSLFNFSSNVVDTAISEQGFTIGINFNGNKSNATIKLSNVTVSLAFVNKLQDEMNAVSNRVSANFDAFVEEEDLVIEFLGTTGTGGSSSGGGVDIDTVRQMIENAIDRLSVNATLDLLSNGYVNLNVELDKGDD